MMQILKYRHSILVKEYIDDAASPIMSGLAMFIFIIFQENSVLVCISQNLLDAFIQIYLYAIMLALSISNHPYRFHHYTSLQANLSVKIATAVQNSVLFGQHRCCWNFKAAEIKDVHEKFGSDAVFHVFCLGIQTCQC